MQRGCRRRYVGRTVTGTLEYHTEGTTWLRRRRTRYGCRLAPRIPKQSAASAFLAARDRAVAAIGQALRQHVHVEPADLRRDRRHQRPRADQGSVHHEQRPDRPGVEPRRPSSGPGSTFSLDGAEHRERRKLLVPPFHGKRMAGYEAIVEEEVMRETESWPEGQEFETLPPMMRITLNAILRTVFGAQGTRVRRTAATCFRRWCRCASRLAVMPPVVRRDLGPWSPWGRVQRLSQALRRDHRRAHRRSTQRPGVRGAQRRARADAAGALRRRLADLRRPRRRRAAHAARRRPRDDGDDAGVDDRAVAAASAPAVPADRRGRRGWIRARQATIWEVQRTRPVIDATAADDTRRESGWGSGSFPRATPSLPASRWRTRPKTASPTRSRSTRTGSSAQPADTHAWIPYGGGIRRCIGAAFANMEMNVTLRTLLREFEFGTTYAPGNALTPAGWPLRPDAAAAPWCTDERPGSKSTLSAVPQRVSA